MVELPGARRRDAWAGAVVRGGGIVGGRHQLIGWRVVRRFGRGGLAIFLIAFALYCVARDARVAAAAGSVIRFGPGVVPFVADGVAAFTLMAAALAVQFALARDEARS